MSIFRWLVLATLGSTLAGVTMIYLFPIEADILVCLNLLLLVATGVLSGFMAAVFERDGVLSNILCNRPKRRRGPVPCLALSCPSSWAAIASWLRRFRA